MLVILFFNSASSIAQFKDPWINKNEAYMWPSFISLSNNVLPSDLGLCKIKGANKEAGILILVDYPTLKGEALSIAYQLIGEYGFQHFGVSKRMTNIIPYNNGVILYLFSKERNRWELLNLNEEAISIDCPYKLFDIIK